MKFVVSLNVIDKTIRGDDSEMFSSEKKKILESNASINWLYLRHKSVLAPTN